MPVFYTHISGLAPRAPPSHVPRALARPASVFTLAIATTPWSSGPVSGLAPREFPIAFQTRAPALPAPVFTLAIATTPWSQ
ncbi:MAG: hypothetical protein BWX86_02538 [Verrucomicrobia bacterium ADurb.Bin122]|nr:MAG: hypothetical protein BWX86_02538 [Verrucomicrobia bacterium ADurb.Bin122]